MWRALFEIDDPAACEVLRRAIIAGYYRESGEIYAKVGGAYWGSPDGRTSRWIWDDGGDVINPIGYQDFPDFPIASQNANHVVGRNI